MSRAATPAPTWRTRLGPGHSAMRDDPVWWVRVPVRTRAAGARAIPGVRWFVAGPQHRRVIMPVPPRNCKTAGACVRGRAAAPRYRSHLDPSRASTYVCAPFRLLAPIRDDMIVSHSIPDCTAIARAQDARLHQLRALTDLKPGDLYEGEDGGLYGQGRNQPPREHFEAAMARAARVQPLDALGVPDTHGLVGLLAVGFSNTFLEFREFVSLMRREPRLSAAMRPVNGAQFHADSAAWAGRESPDASGGESPWHGLEERLAQSGVSALQIQTAWIKLTPREPSTLGGFPAHADRTASDLRIVSQRLMRRFPNLRLTFLSSRAFGGYAVTRLSPEPYAYESAFALRSLILEQIRGSESLNFDCAKGPVRSPLLLWGPYLWASGAAGRERDDLVWMRDDFGDDGTHPSTAGARKVAHQLMTFMTTDPAATPWFLAHG